MREKKEKEKNSDEKLPSIIFMNKENNCFLIA